MSTVTVRDFAAEVKIPVDLLLSQLQDAGVSASDEDSPLSEEDKRALLAHLQSKRGAALSKASGSELSLIHISEPTRPY